MFAPSKSATFFERCSRTRLAVLFSYETTNDMMMIIVGPEAFATIIGVITIVAADDDQCCHMHDDLDASLRWPASSYFKLSRI